MASVLIERLAVDMLAEFLSAGIEADAKEGEPLRPTVIEAFLCAKGLDPMWLAQVLGVSADFLHQVIFHESERTPKVDVVRRTISEALAAHGFSHEDVWGKS